MQTQKVNSEELCKTRQFNLCIYLSLFVPVTKKKPTERRLIFSHSVRVLVLDQPSEMEGRARQHVTKEKEVETRDISKPSPSSQAGVSQPAPPPPESQPVRIQSLPTKPHY